MLDVGAADAVAACALGLTFAARQSEAHAVDDEEGELQPHRYHGADARLALLLARRAAAPLKNHRVDQDAQGDVDGEDEASAHQPDPPPARALQRPRPGPRDRHPSALHLDRVEHPRSAAAADASGGVACADDAARARRAALVESRLVSGQHRRVHAAAVALVS